LVQLEGDGNVAAALVYLPPNYDAQTKVHYPVLYLQHGAGEDETFPHLACIIHEGLSESRFVVKIGS
jgi:enterochelin esterase-like enzyme